jgi:transcriptional regulator with PAS, ATPase and Fis domain
MDKQMPSNNINQLIGVSENISRLRDLIQNVAPTGLNVVITGESGVGKEVVAWTLYKTSPRRDKPFVKVNCAALPEGLLESELFGYERGAFTGAEQKRRGKFELANTGVLLLDEIGDMPLTLQSKLLHVLQSGEFSRLGSEKELKSDAWIIAATNHRLDKEIKEGIFREDLFYRLNIINVHIAPLRERLEDIEPLVNYFVAQFPEQLKTNRVINISKQLIDKLTSYHWPGNVRELQNVLKRIMVLGNWENDIDELIRGAAEDIPTATYEQTNRSLVKELLGISEDEPDLELFSLKAVKKKALPRIEKEVITHVLNKTGWNRTRASKFLEVSYKTLLTKINELDIKQKKSE